MYLTNRLSHLFPHDTMRLGLGCSRLGSVNGSSAQESLSLLKTAIDAGIRFFDTSNIYAQGDSERLLAQAIGQREDCIICSKAGKYLSWKRRLFLPAKSVLKSVVGRSDTARRSVASARSRPMPTCWDAAFLSTSIDGSLKRLKRDRIDVFLLHSPPGDVLSQGDAIGTLAAARAAGKIDLIGASVDDVAAAQAALADSRIEVLQIPLHPGSDDFNVIVAQAAQQGVAVIAREILGGAMTISQTLDPKRFVTERIKVMTTSPDITVTLLGTTRTANLMSAVHTARDMVGA